jgi:hypothetical protein
MTPHTLEMVQTFQSVLGLPPVSEDITADPLASGEAGLRRIQTATHRR